MNNLSSIRRQRIEKKDIFISCVVPVYNEETNIPVFIRDLHGFLKSVTNQFEIIVVDDGSRDQTLHHIRTLPPDFKVKLLGFSRNFGKEIALTAGIDHCSGEVIALIDADFQHPIEMIKVFLDQWGEGYDMIYGVRKNRDNESRAKRNFARIFYWLMGKITKINIPNNAGDFRLMDRKVVDSLKTFHERTRFMKGLFAYVGFKSIAIPYDVRDRASGKSSLGFSRLAELAITGITSFSDAPLRVWGFMGFIISVISLIYAIYIMTMTFIFGTDLPGFPTLVVAIIFFGGIQLMSIGILGEYIARIFTEVKQRPNYIIETKEGFDK